MGTNSSVSLMPLKHYHLLALKIKAACSLELLVAPEATEIKFTSRLCSYKKQICSVCHTAREIVPTEDRES